SRCAACTRPARRPASAAAASVAYARWRAPSSATACSTAGGRPRRSPRDRERHFSAGAASAAISRDSGATGSRLTPLLQLTYKREQDMKKTGAALARFALEHLVVRYTLDRKFTMRNYMHIN